MVNNRITQYEKITEEIRQRLDFLKQTSDSIPERSPGYFEGQQSAYESVLELLDAVK